MCWMFDMSRILSWRIVVILFLSFKCRVDKCQSWKKTDNEEGYKSFRWEKRKSNKYMENRQVHSSFLYMEENKIRNQINLTIILITYTTLLYMTLKNVEKNVHKMSYYPSNVKRTHYFLFIFHFFPTGIKRVIWHFHQSPSRYAHFSHILNIKLMCVFY